MYQHFPFQGSPKYIQIGIFGLKINHLANPASLSKSVGKPKIGPIFAALVNGPLVFKQPNDSWLAWLILERFRRQKNKIHCCQMPPRIA
jgi:hypothetical protein